jgi:predicted permease
MLSDLRYALRRLARDWRFTAAAVAILGLGIGANTAVFSLVNATLFRTPPAADPDRLVDLYQIASNPGGVDGNSYPAYLDMAAETDVFSGVTAALVPHDVTVQDERGLRSGLAEHTTANYLSVLGLRPAAGRWFTADEDAAGAAVVGVVGHQAWIRTFHGDPGLIGRTLRIDGVPVTIVGVAPVDHRGTIDIGLVTDFFLPIASLPRFGMPPKTLDRRPEEAAFSIRARLRDGVTVAQAQAAMRVLGARLAATYPTEDPGKGIAVFPSRDVRTHPQMDGLLNATASVLVGIVGLVLAIACSNLATLLLVRGTARAREVSVRLSLGASRAQLVRQLLTESLVLAASGGAAGVLLAWWATHWLMTLDLPVVVDLALDRRVVLYAIAVSLVTGVAFGLAPALRATRVDLVSALRGEGALRGAAGRGLTLKRGLVLVQVAVSVLLLGVTSLFVQMLRASQEVRAGFAVDGVAIVQTDPRFAGRAAAAQATAFDEIRRRVAALPGVRHTALGSSMPFDLLGTPILLEGDTVAAGTREEGRHAVASRVGPGFFGVLGIPIRYGRALDERDRPGTPRVAVISEHMARRYFDARDPGRALGRRFRAARDGAPDWIEVIGVAGDVRTELVDVTPEVFYESFVQRGQAPTTILARGAGDAAALVTAIQREVRTVDVDLPVVTAQTMAQHLDASLAGPRAVAAGLGALDALGLALAGLGLYAVVSFAVSRRTREIGIRLALGARRIAVVWTVAREVAVLVAAGTAIGLGVTLLAIVALGAVIVPTPGIVIYRPSAEPAALAAIAGFMAAIAALAACLPARRAARMNPLDALRRE